MHGTGADRRPPGSGIATSNLLCRIGGTEIKKGISLFLIVYADDEEQSKIVSDGEVESVNVFDFQNDGTLIIKFKKKTAK